MSQRIAGTLGVLAAIAGAAGLAGCAGAGERLPQCQGRRVPINAGVPASLERAGPAGVVMPRETPASEGHTETVAAEERDSGGA